MRINQFVARSTGLGRRSADNLIKDGRITINGLQAQLNDNVSENDLVKLDGRTITTSKTITLLLNKPAGYVCSRAGQGSRTIYDLLPEQYKALKPVGRLDKDSSGLILLTNDGELANRLTHPKFSKTKVYNVRLDKPLTASHQRIISKEGVHLDDGPSRLSLRALGTGQGHEWKVSMKEGRNRQIRRTFDAFGYRVMKLHRVRFGEYFMTEIPNGHYREIT